MVFLEHVKKRSRVRLKNDVFRARISSKQVAIMKGLKFL